MIAIMDRLGEDVFNAGRADAGDILRSKRATEKIADSDILKDHERYCI
jgi:hypothetical protein